MRVFRYGALSVKSELRSVNLYLVLLFAFGYFQWNLGGLSNYLAKSQERMHVFEMYVQLLTFDRSQLVYLLGVMAISCGSLFYSGGAAYYLIRGNRRRWALGQALYLLVMTLGYNLFLLFSFCFSTGGHLTLTNQWSRASVLAIEATPGKIGCRDIFGTYSSVLQMNPAAAGFLTLLLSVLVGMAAGMVMICFGMRNKGVFGAAILAITWFADYMVQDTPFLSKAKYFSPFGLSRIGGLLSWNGEAAVLYAVVFLCILIAAELWILLESAEKVDFMKLE